MNENAIYQEYDKKLKELESYLKDLGKIFNIESYETLLSDIVLEASNTALSSNSDNVKDYDALRLYILKLDELKGKIDGEVTPFYNMYQLCDKNKKALDKVSEHNIREVMASVEELIDLMNKTPDTTNKEYNEVVKDSYDLIYKVILLEEIYGYHNILDKVKAATKQDIPQSIGRLVYNDLSYLQQVEADKVSRNDGSDMGAKQLNPELVGGVAESTYSDEKKAYLQRRKDTIEDLLGKVTDAVNNNRSMRKEIKSNRSDIRGIRLSRSVILGFITGFILVPVIGTVGGYFSGKHFSDKIDEYRTITKVVDANTRELVQTLSDTYDERENTYTATIKEYSPWKKSGSGYVRNVNAYEFNPNVAVSEYKDGVMKYHYVESKEALSDGDSTEETVLLVTETIQDKNDSRKSTKYIVPLAIVGGLLGLAIDILLHHFEIFSVGEACDELSSLGRDIREKKLSNREIKERLMKLKADAIALKSDCVVAKDVYHYDDSEFAYQQQLNTIKGLK